MGLKGDEGKGFAVAALSLQDIENWVVLAVSQRGFICSLFPHGMLHQTHGKAPATGASLLVPWWPRSCFWARAAHIHYGAAFSTVLLLLQLWFSPYCTRQVRGQLDKKTNTPHGITKLQNFWLGGKCVHLASVPATLTVCR